MASVTKNPMILNSANYIYNWFLTMNDQNEKLIRNSNALEAIESDEFILKKILDENDNEEKYKNISERLENAKEILNGC